MDILNYETIYFDENLPFKIYNQVLTSYPYHWHSELEIVMALNNEVNILLGSRKFQLNKGDFFIVNKNQVHSINTSTSNKPCELLILQINAKILKSKHSVDLTKYHFFIDQENISIDLKQNLKLIFGNILNFTVNKPQNFEIYAKKYLLDLILILLSNFVVSDNESEFLSNITDKKINKVIAFVNENYSNPDLTLSTIAQEFNLTPQYLANQFKKNTNISLIRYLSITRLNKSLQKLITTDENIVDIAIEFGFPNTKSYYKTFSDVINTSPTKYRKEKKLTATMNQTKSYFGISTKSTLNEIFEYLKEIPRDVQKLQSVKNTTIKIEKFDTNKPFTKSFKKILGFAHANYGLRFDFMEQLSIIQKEIGFEYARFHGIFNDEMEVCRLNEKEEIYFNFNHIDALFDNLLKNNIKPFLEIGFMPTLLAKNNSTVFDYKASVSPPKDLNLWLDLLRKFFNHIIEKYGNEEIESWYFEFWNQPDLIDFFWCGTKEEFFDFFYESFVAIKKINSNLKIGGFGNLEFVDYKDWLKDFKNFCVKKNITLDFGSFHIYPVSFKIDNENKKTNEIILADKNNFKNSVDKLLKNFEKADVFSGNYFITEWNSSTHSRDLVHDTCFMNTFIIKNILENHSKVLGLVYWVFTDLFEEYNYEQPLFHGGFGLFTFNGIKKASYYAYVFLNKLGNEIIYQKEDIIVTKSNEGYQILMYNYVHYNELYSNFDISQISHTNRYDVYEESFEKNIDLFLNIEKNNYVVEQFFVNRDFGSSFDNWLEMGAPEILSKSSLEYLKNISVPNFKTWKFNSDVFEWSFVLKVHEIRLITLRKV